MANPFSQYSASFDSSNPTSKASSEPVTISIEGVSELLATVPAAFGLGTLMRPADRIRLYGYKAVPDAAIRTTIDVARERRDTEFGYESAEAYLAEADRLKPLVQMLEVFDRVRLHLEDHLARFRAPAAQETLAEYAVLQDRARVRTTKELLQQIERIAAELPQAGPRVSHKEAAPPVEGVKDPRP